MTQNDEDDDARELRHDLANAEQEKRALQSMLKKAAAQIDDLVETDCEDRSKTEALNTASKLRRAASL